MENLKTSYILSKCEISFLLNTINDIPPSCPMQYILNQFFSTTIVPYDVQEGLVYKQLIHMLPGTIVMEPVVDFLIRSVLSSDTIWIVKYSDMDKIELILQLEGLYLYIRHYKHVPDTWKITPYKDKDTLLSVFNNMTVSNIIRIDKNGNQHPLEVDNNSWIKDDENNNFS